MLDVRSDAVDIFRELGSFNCVNHGLQLFILKQLFTVLQMNSKTLMSKTEEDKAKQ